MIIVNQSVLRRCNPSISLGTSTETLRFTRRVRVSEITKRWRVSDIPHLHLGFNRRVRVSEMSKRWRVSDILHSFHKGFSDSYCEICQQILLCFLKGDQSSVISNDRAYAYLRRAGAHVQIYSLTFLKFTGVVLRVEVQVTFPTSSLSRNTPVIQAVLFEDPNDARFLRVWPVSQVSEFCSKRTMAVRMYPEYNFPTIFENL